MGWRNWSTGLGALLTGIGAALVAIAIDEMLWRQSQVGVLTCAAFALFLGILYISTASKQRGIEEQTESLRKNHGRYETALNNMALGLVMFDEAERLVVCNDRYIEMYGLSREVAGPGCPLMEFLEHRARHGHPITDPDRFRQEMLEQLNQGKTIRRIMTTAAGREISIVNRPMPGGGWIATHEDITEQRKAQGRLARMATNDALTQLPNRLHFMAQLEERFRGLKDGRKFAIHCIDLEHFRHVNVSLGYAAGDTLLQMAAERMRSCLSEHDLLARIGGDEFAILQTDLEKIDQAEALASRLSRAFAAPFDLGGQQTIVGVSIGIAIAPDSGRQANELLRNADLALYRAKGEGRDTRRCFAHELAA